jgi:ribosomal protein S27E
MKIELTCPGCQSTVRVDAVHAGKQVRCPVCGCISQVPLDAKVVEDIVEGETPEPTAPAKPSRSIRDSVFDRPPVSNLPQRIGNGNPRPIDNRFLLAFMWGIGSIISNFVCCGPIVGTILAVVGLYNGLRCKSSLKQSAIVINLVALAIAGGLLAFKFFVFG